MDEIMPLNPKVITEIIAITAGIYFIPFLMGMAVRAVFNWMD